ncbi:RES family NAD+ phosphorylase [Nocardioides carbamazepini]|uniref:RES family NAD+ phosphorylase n=1 Tax=Nocardioides carbamazepini TaxID=2854259 RepID=UPI00214A145C|nr:RES family NAD+ phosphorylase [Nocardioides carbamazepini]MCR1785368.1 RES family NAD+ phosphorylase [Nocardioides carbamazepini]
MPAEPATATPPDTVLRIARRGGLCRFSTINPVDAALPRAGNRFDVVGGGVLYAGTSPDACYAETLSRFRPTPVIRELLKENDPGFMVVGGVPQDWRLQRVMGELALVDPLPFLDVEHPTTHAHLSDVLAPELVALGYKAGIDISDVCNQDRRLSRAIADYAFTATEPDGTSTYSGIRYMSRISSQWECWAIFEGTQVEIKDERGLQLNDAALESVANMWDLRIF